MKKRVKSDPSQNFTGFRGFLDFLVGFFIPFGIAFIGYTTIHLHIQIRWLSILVAGYIIYSGTRKRRLYLWLGSAIYIFLILFVLLANLNSTPYTLEQDTLLTEILDIQENIILLEDEHKIIKQDADKIDRFSDDWDVHRRCLSESALLENRSEEIREELTGLIEEYNTKGEAYNELYDDEYRIYAMHYSASGKNITIEKWGDAYPDSKGYYLFPYGIVPNPPFSACLSPTPVRSPFA